MLRSAKEIAELDERIRKVQYQLNSLKAQRERWMLERNNFKKIIYRNRKRRKQEAKDAL